MDNWIIGVWVCTKRLASCGQITNKDRAASAAFAFAKCQELKARQEVTDFPCRKKCGEMDNCINGVRTFANRLFLLLENVLEWISELLVGHRTGSKMEETIRFLKR